MGPGYATRDEIVAREKEHRCEWEMGSCDAANQGSSATSGGNG